MSAARRAYLAMAVLQNILGDQVRAFNTIFSLATLLCRTGMYVCSRLPLASGTLPSMRGLSMALAVRKFTCEIRLTYLIMQVFTDGSGGTVSHSGRCSAGGRRRL